MTACSAYGCINRPSMKKPGVTFHSFPKDEKRRKQWLVAISREDWTPSKSSKICSEHFPEEMIDRTSLSCVRLKENAVPRSAFDDNYPILDVDKINEQSLTEELHKNAESASLIIQELFSIGTQSSDSESEIQSEKVKVQTMSIQNSVCIRQETRSGVKCKTNFTSPSTAVQNLVSASLESHKKRKTNASVASQTSVSGTINENEEPESAKDRNTDQSGKQKKNMTTHSKALQNSPNAPNLNSITSLIEVIKSSSGNAAKIVVIEGIKNKDSAQKRKVMKLKKALKAERKKVKMLRQKIKIYQKTLSNVTDLLNDIKNQKIDEQG